MQKHVPLIFFVAALLFAVSMYAYERLSITPEQGFRDAIAAIPHDHDVPKSIYEKYYDSLGPERMLNIINERHTCHTEGHNLGRLIYERTQDLPATVNLCTNKCYDGCMHGAMLGFVESERAKSGLTGDPRPEDLTPGLIQKIIGLCDGVAIRYTHAGSCYHAIGHIFAEFTDSNLQETLSLCRTLSGQGQGAVFNCAAGFYMQRSNDYLQADLAADASRLYPCNVFDYPTACYRYRLPLLYTPATTSPLVVSRVCGALNEPDRGACFNASGIMYSDFTYLHPAVVNDVCSTDDPVARNMCLEGVLGRQTSLGNNDVDKICEAYERIPKAQCMQNTTPIYSVDLDPSIYVVVRR